MSVNLESDLAKSSDRDSIHSENLNREEKDSKSSVQIEEPSNQGQSLTEPQAETDVAIILEKTDLEEDGRVPVETDMVIIPENTDVEGDNAVAIPEKTDGRRDNDVSITAEKTDVEGDNAEKTDGRRDNDVSITPEKTDVEDAERISLVNDVITPGETHVEGDGSRVRVSSDDVAIPEKTDVEEDGRRVRISLQSDVVLPEKTDEEEERVSVGSDVIIPEKTDVEGEERHVRLSLEAEIIPQEVQEKSSASFSRQSLSFSSIASLLKKEKRKSVEDSLDILKSPSVSNQENVSERRMSPAVSTNISEDFVIENRQRSESFTLSTGAFPGRKGVDIMTIPEHDELTIEEVEEEEPQVEEEEPSEGGIDRNMYLEMFDIFLQKRDAAKVKNAVLQSKMAEYFLRRRMFYVLKEPTGRYVESVTKYEKNLDALGDLKERSECQQQMMLDEITNLKNKLSSKTVDLDELFERLQQAELDYGKTLTFDRTGRQNMDKIVERFSKRQRVQMKTLKKLRLEYIHLRNRLNEKINALDALDNLGPGFRIMDYVQLKQDNRNLQDKLEEKEDELAKIRGTCKNTMQILAHNREKFSTMEIKIGEQVERIEELASDIFDAREQLNYLKKQRKEVREETKTLKNENGLLTRPKMLRDMENAIKEIKALEKEIDNLEDGYHDANEKTIAIRRNLEKYMKRKEQEKREALMGKSFSDFSFSSTKATTEKIPELIVRNVSTRNLY